MLIGLAAALCGCLVVPATGAPTQKPGPVSVFAAASLSEVLKEIAEEYAKSTGDRIVLCFGASSTLARQIEAGAPADLFCSADEAQLDALERKGLLVAGTRHTPLSNTLAVVVGLGQGRIVRSAEDLVRPEIKRIALADPQAVPAGLYAREYLTRAGVWPRIQSKVVAAENVRAALAAVEAGNAQAAIVYQTDVAVAKRVEVAFAVPPNQTPEVRYAFALVKTRSGMEPARKFLAHLVSARAAAVFRRHGFLCGTPPLTGGQR